MTNISNKSLQPHIIIIWNKSRKSVQIKRLFLATLELCTSVRKQFRLQASMWSMFPILAYQLKMRSRDHLLVMIISCENSLDTIDIVAAKLVMKVYAKILSLCNILTSPIFSNNLKSYQHVQLFKMFVFFIFTLDFLGMRITATRNSSPKSFQNTSQLSATSESSTGSTPRWNPKQGWYLITRASFCNFFYSFLNTQNICSSVFRAVSRNFILQLFQFLRANFYCNFYQVLRKM